MEPAQGANGAGRPSPLRRWGPLGALVIVAAVVIGIIVAGSGGDDDGDDPAATADDGADGAADDASGDGADGASDDAATDGDDASGDGTDAAADGDDSADGATEGDGAADGAPVDLEGAISFDEAQEAGLDIDFGERCDAETGRVKVPSFFAPACFAPFEGDNGGATAPGVTADTIRIVYWSSQEDDIVLNYITDAINNDDTNADVEATLRALIEYYETYYETYGRKVELIFFEGSGLVNDETSARADAVRIAEELEPFMVWGGPNLTNAFAEELAARGIPCIGCGPGDRTQFYADNDPYIWTLTMGPEQASLMAAEFVGTQLAGRPASFAGDEAYQDQERVFGRLWIESGADSAALNEGFEAALADYDVSLAESVSYALDPGTIQETADTVVARLKAAGVTTVLFSGDPVAPRDFTRAATAQDYFPEWVVAGSVLVDTNVFARTYDQEQWANAMGLTTLSARLSRNQSGAYFIHQWFHGEPPAADDSIGVLDPFPALFYAVLQGIGPELTVEGWRDTLFASEPTPRAITQPSLAYGESGRWPASFEPDHLGVDDMSVIWWDSAEVGEDELGREGPGMWQFVDGGVRYLLGEFPTEPLALFDPANGVSFYDEPPAEESRPDYDPLPPG